MLGSKKGVEALASLSGHGYKYRVQNYTSSLSQLTFEACGDSCRYSITFQTTYYVQTTIWWDQGDFALATASKFEELAEALGLDAAQRERLLLFVAAPPNRPEVLVLCNRVFVSQETPLP
jgi:hypothetical protein